MQNIYFRKSSKKSFLIAILLIFTGISTDMFALSKVSKNEYLFTYNYANNFSEPNPEMQLIGDLVANDIYINTPKATKISIQVTLNDLIICDDYSIRVVVGPTHGTASISGKDFIVYTPNAGYVGLDVITYGLTCGGIEVQAKVFITVDANSTPQNIISDSATCVKDMPQVSFNVKQKYANKQNRLDGFSIPLVGDMNGDGKPEIVALGLGPCTDAYTCGDGLSARGRYIIIYDGQTGSEIIKCDLADSLGYSGLKTYNEFYDQFQLRFDPRHNSPSHLAIADLDRDGIGEIVVTETGNKGRVYALKPKIDSVTKKILKLTRWWNADVSFKFPCVDTTTYSCGHELFFGSPMPYISDLNGDGIPEVIVYNKIYNGQTGKLILQLENLVDFYEPHDIFTAAAVVGYAHVGRRVNAPWQDDGIPAMAINDIDNDGIMEIIAGSKIYKPNILNTNGQTLNTFTKISGPASVTFPSGAGTYYLTDGFTAVADVDGDGKSDVIVLRFVNEDYLIVYVWEPSIIPLGGTLKAASIFFANNYTGNFSIPFVGDINGKVDGPNGKKLPEICINMGKMYSYPAYPIHVKADAGSPLQNFWTKNGGVFYGHVVGFTFDETESDISKRLKVTWAMKHGDVSNQTGITMFDFDNDGAKDLVYRDESSLRVISPSKKDFVLETDDVSDPSGVIRFKTTGITSYTGLECPVIADVNGDASADIVTFALDGAIGQSAGYLYVFEADGTSWAPAPPVWNQGIYYPLQVNADLTIPTSPISTLTTFTDGFGNTITPYNGNWIQQPIVQEGKSYTPVLRTPDAVLANFELNATTNKVSLTIKNLGSASLNSNTPVAFYKNTVGGQLVMQKPLGIDIFPNETAIIIFDLPAGNYSGQLIWARIGDNGISFPAPGFQDCDPVKNVLSAIDCPDLLVNIQSVPVAAPTICGTNGAVMLRIVNTDGRYSDTATYQWYKDELIIPGATDSVYFATSAGKYKVYVIDGLCRKFSDENIILAGSLNVVHKPQITALPNVTQICTANGSVLLQVSNTTDYATPIYQWVRNGIPIVGANAQNYLATAIGSYSVYIIDGTCSSLSDAKTFTQGTQSIAKPIVEKQPSNGVICGANGSVILRIANTTDFVGASYQWYLNNLKIATPEATKHFYIASAEGSYTVQVVDNNNCGTFSDPVAVSKTTSSITKPVIASSSANNTLCGSEGSILLSVNNTFAYPAGTIYKWYLEGNEVASGTDPFFEAVFPGNYFVQTIEGTCSAITGTVVLITSATNIVKPLLDSMPVSKNICGDNGLVLLSLKNNTSYTNPVYQWYKNNMPILGDDAKQMFYQAKEAGNYRIKVSDGTCEAFSANITITKDNSSIAKPALIANPPDAVLYGANPVDIVLINTLVYSGSQTYYWYKNDTLQAGDTAVLEVSTVGKYKLLVVDGGCATFSNEIDVVSSTCSISEPVIVADPASLEICTPNGGILFRLENTTDYPLPVAYQWYKDDTAMSGATLSTFEAQVPGTYQLQIYADNCFAFSQELIVNQIAGNIAKPTIETASSSNVICGANGTIVISLTNPADYTGATYQWYKDGIPLAATDNMAVYIARNAGRYRIKVMEGSCEAFSAYVILTQGIGFIDKPILTSSPANNNICGANGSVILNVSNSDDYGIGFIYQWYKGDVLVQEGTTPTLLANTAGEYFVHLTSGACSSTSDKVTLTSSADAIIKPLISSAPTSSNICGNGAAVVLQVTNITDFSSASYKWYKDSLLIAGANSYFYIATEAGAYFVQVLEGTCGAVSATKNVTKDNTPFVKPIIAGSNPNNVICGTGGKNILQSTNGAIYTSPLYQWYKNNMPLAGATNAALEVTEAGVYKLFIIDNACAGFSNEITLTVSITTPPTTITGRNYVCVGTDLLLQSDVPDGRWKNINTTVASIEPSGFLSGLALGSTTVWYIVTNYDGCSDSISKNIAIVGKPDMSNLSVATLSAICEGSQIALALPNITLKGVPTLTESWKLNSNEIDLATYQFTYEDNGKALYYAITSVCGDSSTQAITVTVNAKPLISQLDTLLAVCNGSLLVHTTPTVTERGVSATIEGWKLNGTIIDLATYHFTLADTSKFIKYSATSSCGYASTDSVKVTVNTLPDKPTFSTDTLKICAGSSMKLLANNNDTNNTYLWINKTNTGKVSLTSTADSTMLNGVAYGQETITCTVTDTNTCAANQDFPVKVNNIPQITQHIASETICAGELIEFTVLASGDNLVYQWLLNGQPISGATSQTYSIPFALPANRGTYTVNVSNECGTAL